MSHLHCVIEDDLATITLDNGPQNRLDAVMVDELDAAVSAITAGSARAVLVQAAGPDFCWGGDIIDWPDMSTRELRALFEHYLAVVNRFEQLPLPVVAAVQGLCFGGGLELAVRADVIIAGESAAFGHPEQTLGIITLLGGVYRIAERAGRAKAAEWAFTTTRVPAAEMLQWGVVNRMVPDHELAESARQYAATLAAGPTRAHAVHKALLKTWATGGVAAADAVILDLAVPLFDTGDVQVALPSAVKAYRAGQPRPAIDFTGR